MSKLDQEWGDISGYTPNSKCHICERKEDVKQGNIDHGLDFGNVQLPADKPAKWSLCIQCYNLGWRPYTAQNGWLRYRIYKEKTVKIA